MFVTAMQSWLARSCRDAGAPLRSMYSRDAATKNGSDRTGRAMYDRAVRLLANGVESRADYDRAHYKLQSDSNQLRALQQQASVQLARLDGKPNLPVNQLPRYMQAQAQVDEAQREPNHTVVVAPFAGTVTDVPAIAPGKYLAHRPRPSIIRRRRGAHRGGRVSDRRATGQWPGAAPSLATRTRGSRHRSSRA